MWQFQAEEEGTDERKPAVRSLTNRGSKSGGDTQKGAIKWGTDSWAPAQGPSCPPCSLIPLEMAEIFGHPVHDPVTKRESWPRTDPRAAAAAAANEANIAQDIAHQVGVLVPDVRGGDLVYERVGDGRLGQTG